jgi:hypothetical protein
MPAPNDRNGASAVILSLPGQHSRAAARTPDPARSGEAIRAVGGARLLTLRWLAGRPRVTGLVLAAAGWAATSAAVIAGTHLGRGAVVQIIFAAVMITFATGETLLSPAVPVIADRPALPGAGRYKRLGTLALVTGGLLGPLAGRAALGADWATSWLTTLAVACAVASIAARRLGGQLASRAGRNPGRARARRPAGPWPTEQLPPTRPDRVLGSQTKADQVRP